MSREDEIELPIPADLKHEKRHHAKSLEGLRKDLVEEYLKAVYEEGWPVEPGIDEAIRHSQNDKAALESAINLACHDKECEPLRKRLVEFLEGLEIKH